jgi:hypothetical protein
LHKIDQFNFDIGTIQQRGLFYGQRGLSVPGSQISGQQQNFVLSGGLHSFSLPYEISELGVW